MTEFDVAIAGGGPAGAAAATLLAQEGLRVLLADGSSTRCDKIGEGLPPSSKSLLRELGVADAVFSDGHRRSHGTVSAWGDDALHGNDFVYQLHGDGLQLDRQRFDQRLRERAVAAGAELHCPARLRADGEPAGSGHRLRLQRQGGEIEVTSTWLIDASGRPAVLARRLGAVRRDDDELLAFHLRLRSDSGGDRNASTLVEAVEDGWWYSALLPDGQRLVVLLTDADLVDRRTLLDGDGLWRRLQQTRHLREHCARHRYAPTAAAAGVAAAGGRLHPCSGSRWFAVGDAAVSFDPLSSKGIAHALYSGLCAARALLAAISGDGKASERYDAHMAQIHTVYRAQLANYYAQETRWSGSPFWSRRQRQEGPHCS